MNANSHVDPVCTPLKLNVAALAVTCEAREQSAAELVGLNDGQQRGASGAAFSQIQSPALTTRRPFGDAAAARSSLAAHRRRCRNHSRAIVAIGFRRRRCRRRDVGGSNQDSKPDDARRERCGTRSSSPLLVAANERANWRLRARVRETHATCTRLQQRRSMATRIETREQARARDRFHTPLSPLVVALLRRRRLRLQWRWRSCWRRSHGLAVCASRRVCARARFLRPYSLRINVCAQQMSASRKLRTRFRGYDAL